MRFSLGTRNHPNFKLGKKRVRKDKRNFQFSEVVKAAPPLPASYSFDVAHPGLPLDMFGNDTYGDCVIACRANYLERAELIETKNVVRPTTAECVNEYFKETGGGDDGLVILDSLNLYRNAGWSIGGKNYGIKSFFQVSPRSKPQVCQTIYADCGLSVGLDLPISAQKEINAGKPWAQTTGSGSAPGSWGGHCVLIIGYDSKYVTAVTWAQRQLITWAWLAKYCSEAYGLLDAIDTVRKRRLFDERNINKLIETNCA